jgi:septum formation protein
MIILASKSPRRKELLENIGIKPLIIVSDADENIDESNPEELVKKLSHIKAQAVYDKIKADNTIGLNEDDYILGADTIVYANGNVLGKPKDKDDARTMIKTLSGSVHSVYTGFTLIDSEGNTVSKAVETKVYVYNMSDGEIEDYISTDEPYDKAGAYGIQGLFGKYVEKIEGDYNNVVGLPVSAIYNTLHSNK